MEIDRDELRAIELYNRSAAVQGFRNAPWWQELGESTRELWLTEARRKFPEECHHQEPKA